MTYKDYYKALISEEGSGMTFQDLLGSAFITFAKQYPFFNELLLRMKVIPVKTQKQAEESGGSGYMVHELPTMAVDAKGNIYVNIDFSTQELSYKEVVGVLCHEMMHISLHHLRRAGYRDRELWNIATDLAINYTLVKDGISLPAGGLIPDTNGNYTFPDGKVSINVDDKTSEEIYEELQKHKDNGNDVSDQGGERGEGQDGPFDIHDYDGELSKNAAGQGISTGKMSENDIQKVVQDAADSAEKRAAVAGTGLGNSMRHITGQQKAKLNWRHVMRRYITLEMNKVKRSTLYDRPARISHSIGTYVPMKTDKPAPSISLVAAIDVSGSVDQTDISKFHAELSSLAKTFTTEFEILYWDAEVQEVKKMDSRGNISDISGGIQGGGGTEISSVKRYYDTQRKRPKFIVYLTDGEIYEDTPEFVAGAKRLFIITARGTENYLKPHGETVKMID